MQLLALLIRRSQVRILPGALSDYCEVTAGFDRHVGLPAVEGEEASIRLHTVSTAGIEGR